MSDIQLSNATVFPEDKGMGADTGDYTSAVHLGSLTANRAANSYVEDGAGFTLNSDNSLLTISKTLAFIRYEGNYKAQDDTGAYTEDWPHPVMLMVGMPEVNEIPVESGASNDVYLWVDTDNSDAVYIRIGTDVVAPIGPSVQLGTVNPVDGSSTQTNREVSANAYTDTDAVDAINTDGDHGNTAPHDYTTSADLEAGGSDELNVGGLSGLLADAQTPQSHGNASHSTNFAPEQHTHVESDLPSTRTLDRLTVATLAGAVFGNQDVTGLDESLEVNANSDLQTANGWKIEEVDTVPDSSTAEPKTLYVNTSNL